MQTRQLAGFLLGASTRPLTVYCGDMFTIGRDPQNNICVADVMASRHHAVLDCSAKGELFVKDMGSSNGTWLNERRLPANERTRMQGQDFLRIGGKVFSFISGAMMGDSRGFGARVAGQETVHAGMLFKDGQVIEVSLKDQDAAPRPVTKTQKLRHIGQERESDTFALSGNLGDQSLVQVIQYLHANNKTGELHVEGARHSGLFGFDDGVIFFAEAGERRGAPAIYVCAREHEGTFAFRRTPTPPAKPKNVTEPMMQIIFECCRRIDETQLAGQ
jgi:hypothetical protein